MRSMALALRAAEMLDFYTSIAGAEFEEERRLDAAPKAMQPPLQPEPAQGLRGLRRGRVYPGGSVPGGTRRAIERELRAQESASFNPRGYPSPWRCST